MVLWVICYLLFFMFSQYFQLIEMIISYIDIGS